MDENNKLLILFFLGKGLSQEEGEVDIQWKPLNFMIYGRFFVDLIYDAADEWLSNNTLAEGKYYAVTFEHKEKFDSAGANLGEYFDPVDVDTSYSHWEDLWR